MDADRIDRLYEQTIDAIEARDHERAERLSYQLITAIEQHAERTRSLAVILAQAEYNLGTLLAEMGREEDSREHYLLALSQLRDLLAEEETTEERNLYAQASFNLGNSYLATGDTAAALPLFEAASETWEPLGEEHPDETPYRHDLARSLFNRAYVHNLHQQPADAQTCLRHAITVWEELLERDDAPEWRYDAGRACFSLGEMLRDAGRGDDALDLFRRAVRHFGSLVQQAPDWPDALRNLQVFHNTLCQSLANAGREEAIAAAVSDFIDLLGEVAEARPADGSEQLLFARILHVQAHQLTRFPDQAEAAEAAYRRAIAVAERYRTAQPEDNQSADVLAGVCFDLGMLLRGELRSDAADLAYARARRHLEAILSERPDDADLQGRLAGIENNLGILYLDTGRLRRAEASFRAALRIREGIARRSPERADNRVFLGGTLCNLGHAVRKQGRRDEAVALYNRSIDTLQAAREAPEAGSLVPSFLDNAREGREHAIDPPPPPAAPPELGETVTLAWRPAGPPPRTTPGLPDAPDAALARLEQRLTATPADRDLRLDRADLLRWLGRGDEALAEVDDLLEQDLEWAAGWYQRGLLLGGFLGPARDESEPFDAARNTGAIEAFDRCLALAPQDADGWRYRGRAMARGCHALQAEFNVLLGLFQREDERPSETLHALAEHRRGQFWEAFGGALESFEEVTRLRPDDADAWSDLGSHLLDLTRGFEPSARAAYARLTALRPGDGVGWYQLARLDLAAGQRGEARAHLRRALSADSGLRGRAREELSDLLDEVE